MRPVLATAGMLEWMAVDPIRDRLRTNGGFPPRWPVVVCRHRVGAAAPNGATTGPIQGLDRWEYAQPQNQAVMMTVVLR